MYTAFFGLRELPFRLTPDPRFLFLTPRHREALANLTHAVSSAAGLALLVGDAGTGKTTMLRAALERRTDTAVRCICINNPVLTRDEFTEFLAKSFLLSTAAASSKTALLFELERALHEHRARRISYALVVDEAQSMPDALLEEVRLLANIETATDKLLPVILAGQPELADRLNQPSLRQLKQRIALRCELTPFSLAETAAYMASRLRTAGGDAARIFTREAVTVIHERSQGIARTVNVIAHNALVNAFALDCRPVTRDVILEVCRDFDLRAADGGDEMTAVAEPAPIELEPPQERPEPMPAAHAGRRRIFSMF